MSQEMAEFVLQVSDGLVHGFGILSTKSLQRFSHMTPSSHYLAKWNTYGSLDHSSVRDYPLFIDTIYNASPLGHDFIFGTGEHIYHGFLMARAYAISNKNILLIVILLPLVFASTGLEVFATILDTCQLTFATQKRLTFKYHSKYDGSGLRHDYISDNHLVHVINARHSFVLTVTVTSTVTLKALRPSLQGIFTPVQNVLSAIILCRFQLDLRERHVRRDDCTMDQVTLGTFKAATRRVHEAVVDEFGDTELIDSLQMRQR
ncbi:hypothetical protein BU17DRAFT_63570 [Hysterangium stoloniferum]|nr:hypothetical protein BU17DRAFT_63570 [Hysterangium stoloniferum]